MKTLPHQNQRTVSAIALAITIATLGTLFFLLFVSPPNASGMSANPAGFTAQQPDGSLVHLHLHGDEYDHWLEDEHGYTVIRDRGWHVYAKRGNNGHLIPTGHRVGHSDPRTTGLQKRQRPSPAARNARLQAIGLIGSTGPQQNGGNTNNLGPSNTGNWTGTHNNLVVLLRFSNHTSRNVPSTGDIDTLMNAPGGDPNLAPSGSVRDVYLENSYGTFTLDSTVAYWVTLPNTEAYYADAASGLTARVHEALTDALDVLDNDNNFSFAPFDQDNDGKIDAITFLHSGYAAEWGGTSADGANYTDRIWSHKWSIGNGGWTSSDNVTVEPYHISPAVWGTSGTTIGRIGVICHETGHFLGLPDLYDGNDSDGDGWSGSGIGSYGMMANSWGFDGTQLHPPHFSAWSKIQLGWVTPTVLTSTGSYSLTQSETAPAAFRIDAGYPSGEYLLVENRQPVGTDSAMPQGGLAVFHIDENASTVTEGFPGQPGWPANGNHYKVALLQADGSYDLERGFNRGDAGDLYHGGAVSELNPITTPDTGAYQGGNVTFTGNRLHNISTSGTTMTFSYQQLAPSPPPAAPANLAAVAVSQNQIDLTWTDNSNNELGFKIERSPDGILWYPGPTAPENATGYSDEVVPPGLLVYYRISAYNTGGDSAPSNVASDTTFPATPPATPANLVATALSDTAVGITWTDNATTEIGYHVDRSLDDVVWSENIATLSPDTTTYADTGLDANTTYFYRVRAYTQYIASDPSNTGSATTDPGPQFEDKLADRDEPASGAVSGSYLDTHVADATDQTITEIESGGKRSRRYSFLDHRWRFPDVRGGLSVSIVADAHAPPNSENDDFELEFSTDAGNSWSGFSPPLVVANGTPAGTLHVATFPANTQGTLHVRVVDTDRTQGNRSLDSVSIDQLFIRTEIDPNDFPPANPTTPVATVVSATRVDVTWTDNSTNELGFQLWRSTDNTNWTTVANTGPGATSAADTTAAPGTTYTYRVSAFSPSYESYSDPTSPVTTPDALVITSLQTQRKKGKYRVTVSWVGGNTFGQVDILRSTDGSPFTLIADDTQNDGSHLDDTGLRSGHTLTYRVQSPDGTIISADSSVTF